MFKQDEIYGAVEFVNADDCDLLEYIGLKADSKEIYEGDLCRDSTGESLVAWNDRCASFCLRRTGWLSDHFFGEAVDPEDVELIGNRYENPELLKEE